MLIVDLKSRIESSLTAQGVQTHKADEIADALSQSGGGGASGGFGEHAGRRAKQVFEEVQLDFAISSRTVFYGMAIAMALAFLVAVVRLPGGRVTEVSGEREPAA